jgi:D-alanine-D-alanine ligase-like ATP-grasp enzyme
VRRSAEFEYVTASLLEVCARSGRPGREIGTRLDLIRSTGMRYAAGRMRETRMNRAGQLIDDLAVYEELWVAAAQVVGASVERRSSRILEFRQGDRRTWAHRQAVTLDDPVTLRAALDKSLVHELLTERGIPVPEYVTCDIRDLETAAGFLRRHPRGVVVKPSSGTGAGMGTTAGVRTRLELQRAALIAGRRSPRVLVEGEVGGSVYRLLFLDGELLDVVLRDPPHVVGDGRSSIRELIAAENRVRLAARGRGGLSLITATLDCVLRLERSGMHLGTVPANGRRVQVKTVTNQSGPADSHTVRDGVSADLICVARTAVDAVGLRLAGVDVITADLSQPLGRTGGVVLEVNGNPGLHHHYHVADPEAATPVCVAVLRRALGVDTDRLPAAAAAALAGDPV